MKKTLISILLIMTIIFAGCSSSNEQETTVEVDVDQENQAQTPSVEESIEEDFSEEVEDIELGELI